MKKTGGMRRKTRHLSKKPRGTKGRLSLRRYLQLFKIGERVNLSIEPSVQKGLYHLAFYGRSGIVKGKKGRCYEVSIKDGGKEKTLIVHPVHLKRC